MLRFIRNGLAFSLILLGSIFAQEENKSIDLHQFSGQMIPKTLLKKVSYQFENVTPAYALKTISSTNNINLSYNESDFNSGQKISMSVKNIYLLEAILTVLKDTNSKLQITKAGNVIIEPGGDSDGNSDGFKINGKVIDANTGDPLPGANVMIKGTSMGAATAVDGEYNIYKVPPGTYTIQFSYIGYQDAEKSINVGTEKTLHIDAEMESNVVEGEVVTITAQAVGQLAAINQQLSADAMVNIVDAARIRELPDQNVAESIARLPGITITRNNGEGSGVGIRGLAPQYNQMQIDGVSMTASENLGRPGEFIQDRSVSLSDISQDNLSGIEVYKSITPDKDAATLGGTVNMRLGKAPEESMYEVRTYGAYNGYENDWNQYKVLGKMSRRFLDSQLGVQLSVDAEQRNRGSDRLNGNVILETPFVNGTRIKQYRTTGAAIENIRSIRKKQSINAIFDYNTPETEILFANFLNAGELTSRGINRDVEYLDGYKTHSKSYTIMNSLRGTHHISNFEVEWQLSQYRTKTNTPDDYQARFQSSGGNSDSLNAADKIKITPEDYINLLPDDVSWNFYRTYKNIGSVDEKKYSEKLDITYPFLINEVTGFFKAGVLLKQEKRNNVFEARYLHNGRFPNGAEGPKFTDFVTDYNPDPILNGHVSMHYFLDVDKVQPIWTDWIKDYVYAAYNPLKSISNESMIDIHSNNQNYNIRQNYYAGYFMMKLSAFNKLLTFMPGVRYEGDDFNADGYYEYLQNASTITYNGINKKQNAKRKHGFWLPMVNLRIKPVDWFDTRLAVTKTISRPNFIYLIPYEIASFDHNTDTQLGNPNVKTAESWNYDLSTSFYSNKFGLLNISGFYKEIKNLSYMLDFYIINKSDAIEKGIDPDDPALLASHLLNKKLLTPVNTHGITSVKGIEIDYQANLHALPGLLRNITFSINYTHAFSNSWLRQYSVTLDSTAYIPTPPYVVEYKTYTIGYRKGPMPMQPDNILNVSLGYDIGGFSGRFSAFYQGRSLSNVGLIEAQDTYVEDYLRYDMSLRYRINDHLSFLLTGTNLTNTADITSLSGTGKHSTYDIYGAMYDFGVNYSF